MYTCAFANVTTVESWLNQVLGKRKENDDFELTGVKKEYICVSVKIVKISTSL